MILPILLALAAPLQPLALAAPLQPLALAAPLQPQPQSDNADRGAESDDAIYDRIVLASTVWKTCTKAAVVKYAKTTSEPVATLVTGAIGKCTPELADVRLVIQNARDGRFMTRGDTDIFLSNLSNKWKDSLFTAALDVRAKPVDGKPAGKTAGKTAAKTTAKTATKKTAKTATKKTAKTAAKVGARR